MIVTSLLEVLAEKLTVDGERPSNQPQQQNRGGGDRGGIGSALPPLMAAVSTFGLHKAQQSGGGGGSGNSRDVVVQPVMWGAHFRFALWHGVLRVLDALPVELVLRPVARHHGFGHIIRLFLKLITVQRYLLPGPEHLGEQQFNAGAIEVEARKRLLDELASLLTKLSAVDLRGWHALKQAPFDQAAVHFQQEQRKKSGITPRVETVGDRLLILGITL